MARGGAAAGRHDGDYERGENTSVPPTRMGLWMVNLA